MNVLPFEKRVRVLSALVEGNSIRSTERMLDINRNTIMDLGVLVGEACDNFHRAAVRDLCCSTVQADEIWTFVGKKAKRVRPEDPPEFGDQYVFVGMCADSKLIVSYLVDKRTPEAAKIFVADLQSRVLGEPQITTDGFAPYVEAIWDAWGGEANYGMLVKQFQGEPGHQAEVRYSPGRIRGVNKYRITGKLDPAKVSTSYVERQNLTMRMQIRRFTRLTNAFSKRLRNLRAAVALHFAHFNFCRIHETLRVTPAMQAGLTGRVWSVGDLLTTVLAERSEAA